MNGKDIKIITQYARDNEQELREKNASGARLCAEVEEKLTTRGLNKHIPVDQLVKWERYQCEHKFEKQIKELNRQINDLRERVRDLREQNRELDQKACELQMALNKRTEDAYEYWLDKATEYASIKTSAEDVELLRRFIGSNIKLRKAFHKFTAQLHNSEVYKAALEKAGIL